MLIHQVQVIREYEYVLDPRHGQLRKPIDKIGPGAASTITHEQDSYEADEGGTFDVPGEVAAAYLRKADWAEGPNPFAAEKKAEADAAKKAAAASRKADEARAKAEADAAKK